MSTRPKIFIIILNYNNIKDTIACLDSLKNLDYPDYEIVVVENGSTDGSAERLKLTLVGSDPTSGVRPHLIENKENLGFSGGNNVGITYALESGADYVLLLNNDTIIEPDFLKKLIGVVENSHDSKFIIHNSIGILGPRINYFEPRDLIWFNGGKFGWPLKYNYHLDFREKESELKNLESREVDFITGACILIKRGVFDKIGLLDERFFLYLEDMDFCLRARKAGFKIVVIPEAKIYHKVSATTSKLQNSVIWYYHIRNYLLIVKKNKGFILNLATQLWAWWMYAKQVMKQVLCSSKQEEARIIKQAVTDFYKGKFGKLES